MSSRILRQATLEADARPVSAPGGAWFDPSVQAAIDQAAAEAFERGRREGHAAGLEAGRADLTHVTATVGAAIETLRVELHADEHAETQRCAELALVIAEQVLGEVPSDDVAALVHRVREALQAIDDGPMTLRAHPDQVEALDYVLADVSDLTVAADHTMEPGDGRLVGPWSDADLTRSAAFDAIRSAIRGDA